MEEITEKDKELLQQIKQRYADMESAFEREERKSKGAQRILEVFLFVGIVSICAFALITTIILVWFAFKGISFGGMTLVLIAGVAIFFGLNILQFLMIKQAGDWLTFGLDLARRKGSGFLKFTKSGRLIPKVERVMPWNFFKDKDKTSRFMVTEKGYIDSISGATIYTVREGAINDFDVNKEYKMEIGDLSIQMNNRTEQEFDTGISWNRLDWQQIKAMMIIILICAIGAAIVALAFGATNYIGAKDLSTQLVYLDGNLTAKINAQQETIEQIATDLHTATGVITKGSG